MMRTFFFSLLCFLSLPVLAKNAEVLSQHGNWTAYTFMENGEKVCYMASKPITDEGDYTRRGEIAALITHWPAQGQKNVFSYVAGYPYKKDSEVSVTIGSTNVKLFTQGEMAWAPDEAADSRLINAVRRGNTMVVKGTSSRGTLTTDTFSLNGSTAAYNAITQACGG